MQSPDTQRITSAQLRAARAMARLTTQELAEKAHLGVATVRRAEAGEGPIKMIRANVEVLLRAFAGLGITFASDVEGDSVRLARREHGAETGSAAGTSAGTPGNPSSVA